ncbi:MAG: glycosyltransferase [Candidatus Parcubacteria bacterium]|nr:MAG: glycosyltransferase [Candidatus Parcubacteria bacterium]
MKKFILINSLYGGGAEKVALNLFRSLDFEKIFLLEKDIKYEVPKEKLVFLSNHNYKTSAILKTLFIPIYSLRLKKYLNPDDVIISFLERANYVNILTSLITKHKTIISIRMSQIFGRFKLHPYNLVSKFLYPKANLIVAVSEGIKDELIKTLSISSEKIKVIYNPIFFDEIQEKIKESLDEYEIIFQNQVLINVGRLTKQKGQWYLLRVFKEIKTEFPNLKLIILGEGELKDYLVELSQKLNLKTFVWDNNDLTKDYDIYFLGFQKNSYKFIAKSKIFVFPSLWEGLPNALVEAMACSIPVISSDCRTGPREVLAPETNFAFQTREPEFAQYGILMPVFPNKFLNYKDDLTMEEKIWIEAIKKVLNDQSLIENYRNLSIQRAKDFDIRNIILKWKEII